MLAYWYMRDEWSTELGNVGDIITPWLIKLISGKECIYTPSGEGRFLSCGSVVELIQNNDIVWGSGLIQPMPVPTRTNVSIRAVRGKLTKEHLVAAGYSVPDIFGDPCTLIGELYDVPPRKRYKLGIVSHYIEAPETKATFHQLFAMKDVVAINIINNPKKFIREINECDYILSSSLHGLIIAESYGIPSVYYQLTNKIIGGRFKFDDYYSASNRTVKPTSATDLETILHDIDRIPKPIHDTEALRSAFPLEV